MIISSIMAILLASLTAGIIGYVWLKLFCKESSDAEDTETISYEDKE